MQKKEALSILKNKFRDISLPIKKVQDVKILYQTIKALTISDNSNIPDNIAMKVREIN